MWLVFGPLPAASPSVLDGRANGLWLRHRWFSRQPSDAELTVLVENVHAHHMHDLFFHVGPLDARGRIPEVRPRSWTRTLSFLRARLPEMRAFAWVGGITTQTFGPAEDTVDASLPQVRAAIVATSRALLRDAHFDGIHYDLEIVPNGNVGFLQLLDETRLACTPAPISVASPNLRPFWLPVSRLWSGEYYVEVGRRCDQIAVMSYDTALFTIPLYQRFLAWEVPTLCALLPNRPLLFGVPTYKEPSRSHHPSVETLDAALHGIALGAACAPVPNAFQGIAVYADWTTTPEEWEALPR